MKRLLTLTLFTALAAPAWASSPGMLEGPPGCDWEATVTGKTATTPPQLQLKLSKLSGTCMAEPGPCGQPGDDLTVDASGQDGTLQTGQTVHVWVSGVFAMLTHPTCTRTPIKH